MRELSMHILDVLENSRTAGATLIELVIDEDLAADRLSITVRDNGRGMDAAQVARVFDPFYTTRSTRHVGLGVPLFKAAAQRCNGDVTMTSQPGQGTTLCATFQHSHIDRAPLGAIGSTLMAIVLGETCEIHYLHRVKPRQNEQAAKAFEFHTAQLKAELGDVPLSHPAVREWLQDYIEEGEAELRALSPG